MNSNVLSEKSWMWVIGAISIVVLFVVTFLLLQREAIADFNVSIFILPKINALINTAVSGFLIAGFVFIKKNNIPAHRIAMLAAFGLSVLFLVSYIFYHYNAPQVRFGGEGVLRSIYFFVLITHIILAAIIVPLALLTLFRIWKWQVAQHRKIARITFPIWLYVSITGVMVYLLVSPYYPV